MRHTILFAIFLSCCGCSIHATSNEIYAASLERGGYSVSGPIPVVDAEKEFGLVSDPAWKEFKSQLLPGDELLKISNNSSMDLLIVRDGKSVDKFRLVIY